MAELIVIFWRNIPAQVVVRAGRRNAKRELPPRFQAAIDEAAMRADARDTEAYLAEWRRAAPIPCGEDLETEADAAASRLDAEYDPARVARLVAAGGRAE